MYLGIYEKGFGFFSSFFFCDQGGKSLSVLEKPSSAKSSSAKSSSAKSSSAKSSRSHKDRLVLVLRLSHRQWPF